MAKSRFSRDFKEYCCCPAVAATAEKENYETEIHIRAIRDSRHRNSATEAEISASPAPVSVKSKPRRQANEIHLNHHRIAILLTVDLQYPRLRNACPEGTGETSAASTQHQHSRNSQAHQTRHLPQH